MDSDRQLLHSIEPEDLGEVTIEARYGDHYKFPAVSRQVLIGMLPLLSEKIVTSIILANASGASMIVPIGNISRILFKEEVIWCSPV